VNISVPPKARLSIEVVLDLVCPWCCLGVRRLLRTLRRRPDVRYALHWRPFLLNPDMPRGGMPRSEYVVRKFGGEDRARRLYASIGEISRAEGLEFRFDLIRRTPSSVDAHRLVRWAAAQGDTGADGGEDTTALVEALFAAHFLEGLDIGDTPALAQIATRLGFDGAAARAFLDSDMDSELVHAENLRAHRLGINGVPCFVIGGRHAIAGAQEGEVLERLLDVALVDASES
jgi:predicted DsbA family dithiol-disulfide isomerase